MFQPPEKNRDVELTRAATDSPMLVGMHPSDISTNVIDERLEQIYADANARKEFLLARREEITRELDVLDSITTMFAAALNRASAKDRGCVNGA
jgi:hypothetical protein